MTAARIPETPDEARTSPTPKHNTPRRAISKQQAIPDSHPKPSTPAAQNSDETKGDTSPKSSSSRRSNLPADQSTTDSHAGGVGGDQDTQQAIPLTTAINTSPAGGDPDSSGSILPAQTQVSSGPLLFDPVLHMLATGLDDIEKAKNAQANRYRQLTRTATDKDGEERGFGLDETDPAVKALAIQLETLTQLNTGMTKALEKQLKKHPLWPWIEAQKGLGAKTTARLLHAIRDPYWNDLHNRPRTVSELWAFCGLHVLGGGDTGQSRPDAHIANAGVAPRRKRGQKANWSTDAKTRAYLIAEAMVKNRASAYRALYDEGRERYADAVHAAPCAQCSALPGAPLKDGHKHARAMRLVSKEVLKDLWRESKRIYEQQEQR